MGILADVIGFFTAPTQPARRPVRTDELDAALLELRPIFGPKTTRPEKRRGKRPDRDKMHDGIGRIPRGSARRQRPIQATEPPIRTESRRARLRPPTAAPGRVRSVRNLMAGDGDGHRMATSSLNGRPPSTRFVQGGRLTKDNPNATPLRTMSIMPPPDYQSDWRIQELDTGTLDKVSTSSLLEMLASLSPEVSRALWDFLRLANPGFEIDVFRPGSETEDKAGRAVLDELLASIRRRHKSFDVVIERLFINAFMRGAVFAELVLAPGTLEPLDIATPDAATARFKESDDPVTQGPWILGQWQGGRFQELASETVAYIPIDPFPNSPYGRPMAAPALFNTLFLIGLMHDLRRVVAQQGYPRIDLMVHLDKIKARMPEQHRDNPDAEEAWVSGAINDIRAMYRTLQPDDALIHDDSIEVKGAVGTVDSSSLGAIDGLIAVLERMAVRALKTMPLILGITDGVSEANANRQWEIHIAGIKAVQHRVETLLEGFFTIALQVKGVVADVRVRFAENRSAEELRDQQTLALKITNYTVMQDRGYIAQEEASEALVGHAPYKSQDEIDQEKEEAAAAFATTASSVTEDPEPGSKRVDDLMRFREIMQRRGLGRVSEYLKPDRVPDVEADERIVAAQKTGRAQTIGGKVYLEWDVYFRAEAVIPKDADSTRPLAPLPTEVPVDDRDADLSLAFFDREVPERAGMLDAAPV